MRNVLRNRPDLTLAQLENTRVLMDRYGRGCLATDYAHLIASLTLPDPDDRHVLAAAIAADAPLIVTHNLSDFPASSLSPHGVTAQRPDVFLSGVFDADPENFTGAMRDLLAALKNPPSTRADRLARMRQLGLTGTAGRIEEAFQND